MGFIFISYRREDSEHASDRIYDTLIKRFGETAAFKDDAIPLGPDFRDVLTDAISQCDVLLAVIGDRWLDIQGPNGLRRLEDENDFVRIEIEVALRSGKTVIPLLVGRRAMPNADDLVPSLQALAYRNGTPIRAGRDFQHDMDRLIQRLDSIWAASQASKSSAASADSDIVEKWRSKKGSIQDTQAKVQELVTKFQDYDQAVELLEAIPPRLRDDTLYQSMCQRRNRAGVLDREVRGAIDAMELDGLRPKVEELLALKPQRRDLSDLLVVLSRHEEARRCAEERYDYATAISILEELPDELRDPVLYPRFVSIGQRVEKLEHEIKSLRRAGRISEVQEKVLALLEIVPHRTDLIQLNEMISLHQRAEQLLHSAHDYSGALNLLERIPPDLRDAKLFQSVKLHNRVAELNWEIGERVHSGRFIGVRPIIEELATIAPDSEIIHDLSEVIAKNEEVQRLLEGDGDLRDAAHLLTSLAPDRRDRALSQQLAEREERVISLENEFRQQFASGSLAPLGPILLELSRLTPQKAKGRRLKELAGEIDNLSRSWQSARDGSEYKRALELYEQLPEHLRDMKVYRDLVFCRDRKPQLEFSIRKRVGLRHILELRPDVDEFLNMCPRHEEFASLRAMIGRNEDAMKLFPFEGQPRRALAELDRMLEAIPIELRDMEFLEVRNELQGRSDRRAATLRQILRIEVFLAILIGAAWGLFIQRSLTGIGTSIFTTMMIMSPIIILTVIGYVVDQFF